MGAFGKSRLALDLTDSNRAARFRGRSTLRNITSVSRCIDCGWQTTTAHGAVGVRQTSDNVVGYAGVSTCGRIWLCPVCNAKVMARRAVEIGAVLTWAAVEGLQVIWGSLTSRHNMFDPLARLVETHEGAWRHVVQSRTWSKNSATKRVPHVHGACAVQPREDSPPCDRQWDTVDLGIDGRVGYIRAAEVTIGRNGWHPHYHPIILWRGTAEDAQEFADDVVSRWVEGVEKMGGEAVRDGAQQLEVITGVDVYDALSGYVTKAVYDASKLAIETVWSQSKSGRGRVAETVSHWGLLAAVDQGLADESLWWLELEEATHGNRMITWSRGLRAMAGLGDEKKDEDVAAEQPGTEDDTVVMITPEGWMQLRQQPDVMAGVLDALEAGGPVAMLDYCDENGVGWCYLEDMAAAGVGV